MNIILVVKMCRFEAGELCSICVRFIKPGQKYARTESKIAHYKCARKRNWKREPRARIVAEKKPTRGIRVIKWYERERS